MKVDRIENMSRGWFVGDFTPGVYRTGAVEVGVKSYKPGDYEPPHLHKIATEITLIVEGAAEMNGRRFVKGDIVVMEPGESTDFRALVPTVNVVVKIPGALNDKYPAKQLKNT